MSWLEFQAKWISKGYIVTGNKFNFRVERIKR